ncbi:DUF3386 domain-containing protein [Oxynema aestuarii]|uniref:DUF3386 domain-containing protein n=1 Tax=Oxynema aestuarii AP17 TaxID=2064643 RepID=A0A6H1TWR8_9CYAN|nr:DUF3386 domain-containing protein [Oxynema aestuarii]QIZ70587.1 DUF3386 domain-containing protein [Oxynema aestuarii AP17]
MTRFRAISIAMLHRFTRIVLTLTCCVALLATVWGGSTPANAAPMAFSESHSALEVFREAYENRYTWDEDFPGYQAAVEVNWNGETYRGQLRLDADLNGEVTGIDNPEVTKEVSQQLNMLATHRHAVPFERAHEEESFNFGEIRNNGAVEIDQIGGTPSYYLVRDRKIVQVNRLMGEVAVKVDLLGDRDTPNGYLGTQYRAVFTADATGETLAKVNFEDFYDKIGGYYIPTRQKIETVETGKTSQVKIDLTDVQLLS